MGFSETVNEKLSWRFHARDNFDGFGAVVHLIYSTQEKLKSASA